MFTSHPTLLIGPADWDGERMPQAEFSRRIDALWQAAPDAARAIVYGDAAHHAELAYFTNLTPKLEASVAVLVRDEPPRLFVGGGANMLGAARPLTWVADMLPLQRLGPAIKEGTGTALLINARNMAMPLRRTITEALGEGATAHDASAGMWSLMRRKSAAELDAIREACSALHAAMTAIAQAQHRGAPATAVLAGERAANQAGAQDVRTLFSLDGGRTLTPFTGLALRAADPLQVYVAVRCFNYWAEGFAPISAQPSAVSRRAHDLLQTILATIKAGTSTRTLVQGFDAARAPYQAHPVTERAIAVPIGLALEERPHTNVPNIFESGDVYSLRIGLTGDADQHAIVSAMIAVGDKGSEVLWSGGAI
jgi:hypothetical protein